MKQMLPVRVQAALHFASLPCSELIVSATFASLAGATHISPERTLPVLVRVPDAAAGDKASGATDGSDKAGDAPIAGSGQIVDYLASSGDAVRTGSSDGLVSLSPTEAADMEAYTAMVEHKL